MNSKTEASIENEECEPIAGSSPPVVVSVRNFSKTFKLPHHKVQTLKERVLHPLRRSKYDNFEVLKNLSFDVYEGEFFGILGRNGCGKSTLLKCLAGIYQPNSGEISVEGRISPFIELGVGFNPDLPARENVMVNAALLGLSPREALERFDSIIEYAELEDFVDLKFKNYSSGMQVRLGFASAIQADADVLLVDEVLAVGDANFQQKCFNTFRDIKRRGRTVLFVTHDMDAVERFCDRALYLEGGKIHDIGNPTDIIAQYTESNLKRQRQLRAPLHVANIDEDDDETAPDSSPSAEILAVWVEDKDFVTQSVLKHDEMLNVRANVVFHEDIEHPIVNITIHSDEKHRPVLFWASTETAGLETPNVKSGDILWFALSFHNLLVSGRYHISISITNQNGSLISKKHDHIESFLVSGSLHGTGLVVLPHSAGFSVQDSSGKPMTDHIESS